MANVQIPQNEYKIVKSCLPNSTCSVCHLTSIEIDTELHSESHRAYRTKECAERKI